MIVNCPNCNCDMQKHYATKTERYRCHGIVLGAQCMCDHEVQIPRELQLSMYVVVNHSGQFFKEIRIRGKKKYDWCSESRQAKFWRDPAAAFALIRRMSLSNQATVAEYKPRFVNTIDDPNAKEREELERAIKDAQSTIDASMKRLHELDTRSER